MRTIEDWTFTKQGDVDKEARFRDEFLSWVRSQKFRHPGTGNQVRFVSLPSQEQKRVYQQWRSRVPATESPSEAFRRKHEEAPTRPRGEPIPGRPHHRRIPGVHPTKLPPIGPEPKRELPEGMAPFPKPQPGAPLPPPEPVIRFPKPRGPRGPHRKWEEETGEQVAALGEEPDMEQCWGCFIEADAKNARMEDYAFSLPFMPTGPTPGTLRGPSSNPGATGDLGEEPPEPPPPAEIRRMMSERMRDMGRALMISGVKQPRQQMIAIGAIMHGLLDQLDALADQPGRNALKRRMLLQLRPRVMNPSR